MGLLNTLLHRLPQAFTPTQRTSQSIVQKYVRPANANEQVMTALASPTLDTRSLSQIDTVLKTWAFTGAKPTRGDVEKLVGELGSMTPGKDEQVRRALSFLRAEHLPSADANALVDAIRVVRARNFIATVPL